MRGFTRSASTAANAASTRHGSVSFPTGRSCSTTAHRGSSSASELLEWTPAGYRAHAPRPSGAARLITPPTLVAVLREGWEPVVPLLHPSAGS